MSTTNITEAKVQSRITKWIRLHAPNLHPMLQESFAYEVKVMRGNTLPRSSFRPQQLPSLLKARSHESHLHKKLSDADPSLKPCDGFYLHQAKGYVFVYIVKSKQLHVLDVTQVVQTLERKPSLTQKEIETHSLYILDI